MGTLSRIAIVYGFLVFFSVAYGNLWLSLIVGLLSIFLIISLSVKLDEVDDENMTNRVTLKIEVEKLKKEIEELKNAPKEAGSKG